MAQKETKAKVPNRARSSSTDENGEGAITGRRLALPARTKFGTLEASDEHLFEDVAEGRPTAVAKDRMGRFQDRVYSRKRRKDQAVSKTVRGPPAEPARAIVWRGYDRTRTEDQ